MKNIVKKNINKIFKIFLALIPNKFLRAKLKADWTKLYILKYVNIAYRNYKESIENKINENPPIYQYWEQGIETAPEIIRVCTSSIDKFETNSKHIILDKNNLGYNFINQ